MTRAKDISKILTDADISGNIDVDGVTNLDVVDIDGTLNVAGETTLQTHLNMGDDDTIKLGAGVDLTLASNGTHGTIATPNGILTVDAASTLILDSDAGNIQLKDGGNNFMTLSQTSSTVASINIPTSDGDLHIVGNDGGVAVTAMSFDMSAGGAATIANGLTLTDGNLVVASGHGIDFSATGNVSGTSSELLDDYEEGTWTPAWAAASGSATQAGVARYVKIGNMVQANCYLALSNKGTLGGSMQITGLPYTSINVTSNYYTASMWINSTTNGNKFDGDFHLQSYVSPNTTVIKVYSLDGDGVINAIDAGDVTNATDIMINISYRAQ